MKLNARIWVATIVAVACGAEPLWAQQPAVTLSAGCSEREGFVVCRYSGEVTNKKTDLSLPIDERVAFRSVKTSVCETSLDRAASAVTCSPQDGASGAFAFELSAVAKDFRAESQQWAWKQDGKQTTGGEVLVPVAAYDPSAVRPMFGGGASFPQDDRVNFQVKDGHLLVVNDSPARAAALVGLMFTVAEWRGPFRKPHPISVFFSLEFAEATTKVLDGFLFGLGYDLTPYLSVVAGYSLARGQELSPGFRREAQRVVQTQLAANNAAFKSFEGLESDDERYDGLPLTAPGASVPFFVGSPIVESFNKSWHVGLAIPVSLKKLLQ